MSKSESDTHLKYGQGILVKGYNAISAGIMTTKGFADTRVRFETYDDILYFKNYRNAIFQILPASSFDINDQLHFLRENNLNNAGSNIEIVKAKAKSESDQFDLTIKSKQKSLVCFGDQVVLKHIDSDTYLSGTLRPSQGNRGSFSVQVTNKLKTSLIWKLLPYRSFQNQSNPIPLQSPILIENISNNGFLTFQRFGLKAKKQNNNIWQKQPIKSDQSYKIPVKTDSNNSEIYECVTHFLDLSVEQTEEQMPWKFELHFNDVQNDNLIQHDIVYFQHTENNGVLAAGGDQEIILKELKGEKTSELCFYDCLWEIEEYKEKSPHSYILRHLMSGMTFGFESFKNPEGKSAPLKPKLNDISDGKGNNEVQLDKLGVIQLKLAKKSGGQISSKSYINICSNELCLDIAKDSQKEPNKKDLQNKSLQKNYDETPQLALQNRNNLVDLQKMAAMAGAEFDYEIKKLDFTLDISKHCFVIQEIDSKLKSEVLFALSFHSRLINLKEDLKWGASQSQKKVTYLRMMQITQKTRQIKYFLKNTPNEDPKQFKRPLPKRQIICLHLGISELLFQLLYFMRKNRDGQYGNKDGKIIKGNPIFKQKPNELQKFIQMYNTIYEVIFQLIRDNKQFKIHVSKWIGFIIQDVIRNNEEYQLKTLLELLKNNSFFVNNFVTEQLVQYLVSQMIKPSDSHEFHQIKYIQIFRAFCICGDEVNSDNQVLILNKFIKKLAEDEQRGCKYQIKLSKKKNQKGEQQIGCTAAFDKNKPKWRKFADSYKICRDQYPSAWSYMVAYLHLIADICRGRNKITQSYISTTINLDVVSELMIKQKLYDAQVPMIRIMHYLFAESQYFYPIQKISRVCNYNALEDQISINSSKSQVRPHQILGAVMNSLIQKLQSYGPIEVHNNVLHPSDPKSYQNQCLYAILSFLKQTFVLGFWQEKQQVQRISNHIGILIEPKIDIDYQLIREQSQRPDIVLMINCKLQCMEILQYIINLDIDYYLKHFSRAFKNFELPARPLRINVSEILQENTEDTSISVQFFQKFNKQNSDLKPIVSTQICPKIIQLSKHNHPNLTGSSLRILQKILDFYKHVSKGFFDTIFICQSNRNDLHKFIEKRLDKFFTLQYQTTTKINITNQKSLYFMMYRDEKDAGVMQDLYMISELVKNQNSLARIRDIKTLDSSRTYSNLAVQKLINFTSERRSSNNMKQKVVDASDIHLKVLKYILNCKQIPTQTLALKLLHLCYRFLVSIIENNQQIKLTLVCHIPKMIHHITCNVGCIDFFKEMYDNNRNMLYNEAEILKLIKVICQAIQLEDINSSYYKSKLLDFFRYLIYCNGHAFNDNQIQILKIMQDDSFKNIIINIDKQTLKSLVKQYMDQMSKKNVKKGEGSEGTLQLKDSSIQANAEAANEAAQSNNECVKMSPKLTYIITFFQIMVSLIDDKCRVNSGKLVKKFPFDRLVEFIEIADKCWPLKRNIRAFINRLYYFEPQIETYTSTIQTKQIENIIRDLNDYISIKCKATAAEFQQKFFENPVRFSFLESYLYLNLEQNLFTLYQIIKNNKLLNELKNFLHSAKNASKAGPYNFIKICERLGWIRNYFANTKNIFTTSFIKFLLTQLKKIIDEFDDNIYSEGMMFPGDKVPKKQEKDDCRKQLIKKIMLGEISTFFVQGAAQISGQKPLVFQTPPKFSIPKDVKPQNKQKLIKKLKQIMTRTKRQYENKDDQISDKQKKLVKAFKLSKEMNEVYNQKYNNRLSQIIEFSKRMQKDRQQKLQLKRQQSLQAQGGDKNKILTQSQSHTEQTSQSKSELVEIKTLLEYVSSIISINSTNPQVFSPKIKIFFLQMIIGIIQQSNKTVMKEKKSIDEWEVSDWEASTNEIKQIQITLKNGFLGTLIAEILKENIIDNISLANSTLLCGIAYLLGGNKTTQDNLIAEIKNDPDNKVFRNIMQLIQKLGKLIIKNVYEGGSKSQQENQEFQVQIIDNYDFYDQKQKFCLRKNVIQPSSTDDQIYHRQCIAAYHRAFRFLQLLCQNNNIENKKYIRDQPNKMDPVNFITVTTNQLRKLFQVMCKRIVTTPLFLLDFLMQVTQIPVKQNQQTLMNSSFFEDLCQMSNQFSKDKKQTERGFEQGQNPLQQIYKKSVKIILSNFQGNQQDTYISLDSKLDPKFLVNILQRNFKNLQISSKQQLLVYLKNSLETTDPETGAKTVSTMYNQQIMGIFDILIIFMKLKQKLQGKSRLFSSYQKFKNQDPKRKQMLLHLQNSLKHIQINDSNDQKQTIYFVKQPSFYSLSSNIRDYVMSVVKRGTHRDKIVSLIGYIESIKESIEYSYRLQKSEKIVQSNMVNSYKYASFMSIVICLFMFLYYGVIIEYGEAQFTSNRVYRSIRFILSLIQLSLSISYVYYWFVLKVWSTPAYKPKQNNEKQQKKDQQKFYHNKDFLRLLLFVSVSFYGTFIDPTIFFIHIIDIFCQSPLLANIFKAIANTIVPVGLVSFMGVIFVIIFCTVTFSNYTKDVYSEKQAKRPSQLCDSMGTCMMDLYVSGSIGETMTEFQIQRFIYDTIYAIFFQILFGNIISGIMLDAFGSLRQSNEQLKNDKANTCYICNIQRQQLQKKKIKFKDHIQEKHFLWDYVFYIISLKAKDQTDFTGLQYEIFRQIDQTDQQMKINWIPDGEQKKYNPVEKLQSMIKNINQFNDKITNGLNQFDNNVKEFNQKAIQLRE